jgi:hypothetical protein
VSSEPLNVGDAARLVYTVEVNDVLTDATVVYATIKPDGTAGPSGSAARDSLGTYSATFTVDQAGLWRYTFTAAGAATEVSDGQFVVRPAAAADVYCTVGEVRGQLGADPNRDLTDQSLLERAVAATSRAIDDYCSGGVPGSRRFWRDTTAVPHTFWTDDPERAWVDDISSTTGLLVKTDEDGDGTFETTWTQGTDFQLEPLNADLAGWAWWEIVAVGAKRFPFYPQRAGLQVTARFGWPQVPVKVNQAAVLKAAKLYRRKDSLDGFADVLAGARISRYEDPDVAGLLEPFTKRRTRTLDYTPQRSSLFHGGRR